ncbi:MAG: hypothetical protein ACRBBP_09155 [Bdellovibrionales bacterium]
MTKYGALIFFYTLLIAFHVGCSRENNISEIDKNLIEVYKLIDSDRSIEAIGYVDSLLEDEEKEENIYSLEMAQASAYAKLAGFSFKKLSHVSAALIGLVNAQTELKMNKESLANIEKEKAEIVGLDDSEEKQRRYLKVTDQILEQRAAVFSNNVDLYAAYIKILMGMPSVQGDDAIFLEQAIYLMDEYGETILPADATFRALLKALKARNRFTEELFRQKDSETCTLGLTSIYGSLINSREGLDNILEDLTIAQPSSGDEIKALRVQIRNGYEALTAFKSLTNLMDDLAKENFSVFSFNLDEIFKFNCSSY